MTGLDGAAAQAAQLTRDVVIVRVILPSAIHDSTDPETKTPRADLHEVSIAISSPLPDRAPPPASGGILPLPMMTAVVSLARERRKAY
jgi:hypothetical protein